MCALAEVHVITRTEDNQLATRLEFDRQGRLNGRSSCARGVGTTVGVKQLFSPLPVRRQVGGWLGRWVDGRGVDEWEDG